ncbi:hypothetical protein I8752_18640 [Nostocaceae cyanobacterium CENA369]|uniref:DUF1795 domain-containing protein n=1 Tax=Dendronalium phyllosphericum CENA369 TaxID=1725256 RepID=A0A8J7I3C8_9NOST|nr:hypothetical protein [Dendronalium phyllosphericum]MBH8574996.1 hypothetical protein [Dendronalium phyllosphericum CENA369]
MKLKLVLLGLALASVTLVASSNIAQAQCPHKKVVPPVPQTRIIRQEKLGYRFSIPNNYRTMAFGSDRLLVLDPNTFAEAQCLVKNKVPTELPRSITIYVKSVNLRNRSLVNIVRQDNPTIDKFENTKVANQSAVNYTSDTLGFNKNVSFFTPDRKYLITVSVPFEIEQGRPTTIFNKQVFDKVISSFTFVR